MKVIDLLNKIANGEEVPKKIKIYRITFELEYDEETESNYYMSSIDGELLNVICASVKELNEEIEIIEENKPIEKIKYEGKFADAEHQEMRNKINEIIDRLNNLEKGNENE